MGAVIRLAGWTCACGAFNGEERETRAFCRTCERPAQRIDYVAIAERHVLENEGKSSAEKAKALTSLLVALDRGEVG